MYRVFLTKCNVQTAKYELRVFRYVDSLSCHNDTMIWCTCQRAKKMSFAALLDWFVCRSRLVWKKNLLKLWHFGTPRDIDKSTTKVQKQEILANFSETKKKKTSSMFNLSSLAPRNCSARNRRYDPTTCLWRPQLPLSSPPQRNNEFDYEYEYEYVCFA